MDDLLSPLFARHVALVARECTTFPTVDNVGFGMLAAKLRGFFRGLSVGDLVTVRVGGDLGEWATIELRAVQLRCAGKGVVGNEAFGCPICERNQASRRRVRWLLDAIYPDARGNPRITVHGA